MIINCKVRLGVTRGAQQGSVLDSLLSVICIDGVDHDVSESNILLMTHAKEENKFDQTTTRRHLQGTDTACSSGLGNGCCSSTPTNRVF